MFHPGFREKPCQSMLQSPPSNLSVMFSQPVLLFDHANWGLLNPKAIARVLIEEEKNW